MISSIFMESALRSVLFALTVWIGLRVFAVRNVLAQKMAWGLVLASALTMPVVLPMTEHWSVLPANVRVTIPADPANLLEELQARIQARKTPAPQQSAAEPSAGGESVSNGPSSEAAPTESGQKLNVHRPINVQLHLKDELAQNSTANRFPAPVQSQTRTAEPANAVTGKEQRPISLMRIGGLLYLAVAGVLLTRLFYGLLVALRLLHSAKPVLLDASPLSDGLCLRVSDSVSSPVTIGSAVVLPSDCREWDSEKLRIVLAHERSHIRQGDFYLQLVAGIYAAAVWFSPLGWWLKHKLSELAEAISDHAGLEEATDPTSYARILLEFAAAPRPTILGVAMARHGSLSRRIERLLNDASFRQAFANTRRGLAAVLLVPVALFAATTLVRVQAAGQQSPAAPVTPATPTTAAPPQPPAAPPALTEGVSNPEQLTDEMPEPAIAPQATEKPQAPKAAQDCPPDAVLAPPAAPGVPAPRGHIRFSEDISPVAPIHAPNVMILKAQPGVSVMALPKISMSIKPMVVVPRVIHVPANASLAVLTPFSAAYGEGRAYGIGQSTTTESGTVIASKNGKRSGYRYSYSSNGDSYAIVRGDGSMSFNGNIHSPELDKARKQASGKDFLWFERGGKQYIVDDPSTMAQIEAMYKPMEDLGRQQEELGKKQEALGKQQEELGKKQEAASVPTPDMSKEIAQIEESMAKLKAAQGKNMTQDQFGELQEKLGELQSRIGEIQGQIGEKQGQFGEQMGALGDKMGVLGQQMGQLGEQMGKIGEQADQKVRLIIDQSLKDGKAHPVQ